MITTRATDGRKDVSMVMDTRFERQTSGAGLHHD
jgi:hypothetical protein